MENLNAKKEELTPEQIENFVSETKKWIGRELPLDPGLHINAFLSLLYSADLAQNLSIKNRPIKSDEGIPLCLKGNDAAFPPDRMNDTVKNGIALPVPEEDQVSSFQGAAGDTGAA